MNISRKTYHVLNHWGWGTHICIGNLTIIGSDNAVSPGWRQAIIWTYDGILLIGPLGTYFSEIWIAILTIWFKKMHLKVSSAKWWPFCLSLKQTNYIILPLLAGNPTGSVHIGWLIWFHKSPAVPITLLLWQSVFIAQHMKCNNTKMRKTCQEKCRHKSHGIWLPFWPGYQKQGSFCVCAQPMRGNVTL